MFAEGQLEGSEYGEMVLPNTQQLKNNNNNNNPFPPQTHQNTLSQISPVRLSVGELRLPELKTVQQMNGFTTEFRRGVVKEEEEEEEVHLFVIANCSFSSVSTGVHI